MRTRLFFSALAAAGLFIACGAADKRSSFNTTDPDGSVGEGGPSFTPSQDAGANNCATATAAAVKPPLDIIVIVDQSESMDEEIVSVKASINNLSTILNATGIDYHVVMIATKDGANSPPYNVCVPPPLGGPNCDSNGSTFRLVNEFIYSNDGLKLTLATLDATAGDKVWADFLRPNALKVFIPVTDDDSTQMSAVNFDAQLLGKAGGAFGTDTARNYRFYPIIGASTFPSETKCGSGAVNNGPVYIALTKMTGGKWFPVCTADFAPVFNEIGSTLAAQSACELSIPTPANGGELDPDKVNVKFTSADGKKVEVVLQDKSAGCEDGANGWQYSADGKKVLLCGAACEEARNDPGSKVDVEFGCATQVK
jgi:hypothetical protein